MSTQVHYLRHCTVQYSTHSFMDSGDSRSASRVACSFGSRRLYICLSNKCFKVYPAYSLCDRRKTLTGSLDPTYMQPTDEPCILNCKSTSTHLSVMHCSHGSRSLTVNWIADCTDCVTWGGGDNVSCLPCSAVWSPNGSGTAWSSSSLSSVESPSVSGTAMLVLGL